MSSETVIWDIWKDWKNAVTISCDNLAITSRNRVAVGLKELDGKHVRLSHNPMKELGCDSGSYVGSCFGLTLAYDEGMGGGYERIGFGVGDNMQKSLRFPERFLYLAYNPEVATSVVLEYCAKQSGVVLDKGFLLDNDRIVDTVVNLYQPVCGSYGNRGDGSFVVVDVVVREITGPESSLGRLITKDTKIEHVPGPGVRFKRDD